MRESNTSKTTEYRSGQQPISSFIYWLIVQKWLWKKVVFDNGIVGRNYHRYDHMILPYSQGMGEDGEDGNVHTAIKWQLFIIFETYVKS
jgi:hypothetical protein